jgi:hypothetical protein
VGVDADVVTVKDCEVPELMLRAVGLAATPAGRPAIVTDTLPLNPLEGVIDMVTGVVVAPTGIVSDEGETDNEKSGEGPAGDDPPPPHEEQSSPTQAKPMTLRAVFMHPAYARARPQRNTIT